ncbi:ABC transporter permease [Cryptosporangium sp. NPDC051539]|uniref:ABC transporter permease n=1 Tax=Cryptosporangium sp. NPDC051539 TaxID=3363962 RepID=UPI00378A0965
MLRATFKGLLGRRRRLVLSGLAVVLGVMFVSGSFVLTDTLGRSAEARFAGLPGQPDVSVGVRGPLGAGPVPASAVARIGAVPGVARAVGVVSVDGARLIGVHGKVVASSGMPRLGVDWPSEAGRVRLAAGRGPRADSEMALDAALARAAGIQVGDRAGVLTLRPRRVFTVVGLFTPDGGGNGTQIVAFSRPVAQALMVGEPGSYSSVSVTAARGVSVASLRERLATTLGPAYTVRTGAELGRESAAKYQQTMGFLSSLLLGFAGVSLFVGAFLVLNTFSILVAQRTGELALFRALSAGRRQLVGSLVVEASVVGLFASVAGLVAGIAVGAGLAYGYGARRGLDSVQVGVPASAVAGSFAVGLVVTVAAALIPAVAASKVLPIAAMREAATPDRPLTRLTVAGALTTVAAAGLLGGGLARPGENSLALIFAGVLLTLLGTALLTPQITRPAVGLLGRAVGWSVPGRLARHNARRNPRRTAITAAALMVTVALVAGVSTVIVSATRSVGRLVDRQITAELIVTGASGGNTRAPFDPAVLTKASTLPSVAGVTGLYEGAGLVDGQRAYVEAVTDLPALRDALSLTAAQGRLGTLGDHQVVADQRTVAGTGLRIGDPVSVQLPRGGVRRFTLAGVYTDTDLVNGWLLPASTAPGFRVAQPTQAFVTLRPGADVAAARTGLAALLAANPEAGVFDRHEYSAQQNAKAGAVLGTVQLLLALAILIAVLGVVNTVALSILERGRELGLLRAVGLRRDQTIGMVMVEATLVSALGALLGVLVGAGLGAATVRALAGQGVTTLAVPWPQLAGYLGLAAFAGVVASVWPALRAARVDVLAAIS